ncbi:P-II family nitrogen regulator [Alkalicoccus daliensis]|uniref:Nitrogen regulatory protein P-II family n=1 Tax=Alkalicoccus daliensis TaxID=745820 RepID=A0A1H0ECY4_9BACI|nr:hypothetical protein [Alkalicoccus daliensis]SDN80189.1 hypothetical protein SAMN04488053_103286 [Alkalicoccus daliensis]
MNTKVSLVVAVLDKKVREDVVMDLEEQHGITKQTYFLARGHGDSGGDFFGMQVEPERERVLFIVPKQQEEEILSTVQETGGLNEPGNGIVLSLDVNNIKGLL